MELVNRIIWKGDHDAEDDTGGSQDAKDANDSPLHGMLFQTQHADKVERDDAEEERILVQLESRLVEIEISEGKSK